MAWPRPQRFSFLICDAGGAAAERVVAVVARDLRVGRVLLAGDRDGRPDLVEVGKQLLRSGALGAVADRLRDLKGWARPVEDCVSVAEDSGRRR